MTEYELWSFGLARWATAGPGWIFHGYHRMNLYEVLQFERYGYCVRKVIGDRSDTIPLFPLLGSSGQYPGQGLEEM